MKTVRELIREAENKLDDEHKDVNVAKVLFYHLAHKEPHELYLMMNEEVDEDLEKAFLAGMEQYYQGNYNKKEYINHYAKYYGDDYAEVIFDFSNPNKQNLLVLCTSYSNAIKQLLASHFNKTYYIDLRHNKDFKVNEYIEENDIDKVLLLGDIYSFIGGGE